mgnify:CR=1 FL=1
MRFIIFEFKHTGRVPPAIRYKDDIIIVFFKSKVIYIIYNIIIIYNNKILIKTRFYFVKSISYRPSGVNNTPSVS